MLKYWTQISYWTNFFFRRQIRASTDTLEINIVIAAASTSKDKARTFSSLDFETTASKFAQKLFVSQVSLFAL